MPIICGISHRKAGNAHTYFISRLVNIILILSENGGEKMSKQPHYEDEEIKANVNDNISSSVTEEEKIKENKTKSEKMRYKNADNIYE